MKIHLKEIQSAVVGDLPLRARWTIKGTPLDYDFSAARKGLRPLPEDTFDSAEKKWLDLLIFGDYDYAEGGGAHPFLGIRKTDGAVYGLDVERAGEAMFLLNSSIERFIRTFLFLNKYLGKGRRLPTDVEARMREIDPEIYPASDWKLLVDHLTD